jgi:hypothetical protein
MTPMPTFLDVFNAWSSLLQGGLRSFTQPILPNWTFNIDSNNSSSPQTEADVVAQFSYGKQLGKINDALAWLIAHREDAANSAALSEFTTMKNDIDLAKAESAAKRLEQTAHDLTALKISNPLEFRRVSAVLRKAIGPATGE